MNTTVNASTGFTPFHMLYGSEVALPIDHALPATHTSVAKSHVAKMRALVQEARAAMAKA